MHVRCWFFAVSLGRPFKIKKLSQTANRPSQFFFYLPPACAFLHSSQPNVSISFWSLIAIRVLSQTTRIKKWKTSTPATSKNTCMFILFPFFPSFSEGAPHLLSGANLSPTLVIRVPLFLLYDRVRGKTLSWNCSSTSTSFSFSLSLTFYLSPHTVSSTLTSTSPYTEPIDKIEKKNVFSSSPTPSANRTCSITGDPNPDRNHHSVSTGSCGACTSTGLFFPRLTVWFCVCDLPRDTASY